jgi:protein-S-isoprenylcysteine O-methyltransferase Ste14
MSWKRIRWKRLLWTVLVTFYFLVFFRNLFTDALAGRSWLPTWFFSVFTIWMAFEYYFGSPFFQSGVIEPAVLWKSLFALFYYPFVGYCVADFTWTGWTRISPLVPWLNILGVLIFMFGAALRLLTLRTLVRAQPNRLVRSGLFRFVRHPRYLASLVQLIAVPLAFSSWLGLVLALGLGLPLLLRQVGLEDTRLRNAYGDDFAAWQQNVPKLIPGFGARRA